MKRIVKLYPHSTTYRPAAERFRLRITSSEIARWHWLDELQRHGVPFATGAVIVLVAIALLRFLGGMP